ncbi:hypothetical protein GUJ93_ZPchr0001g32172 [Zizania palustris]|uniref:Uncharacterized protein n=1 Tax=Zizania palustris TaxID=103762 RepID=A0A8J5V6W5_ZIZPA|nr:hypothetical protein GUJ93_ZPchr0001g32172 [Zizania palustris]
MWDVEAVGFREFSVTRGDGEATWVLWGMRGGLSEVGCCGCLYNGGTQGGMGAMEAAGLRGATRAHGGAMVLLVRWKRRGFGGLRGCTGGAMVLREGLRRGDCSSEERFETNRGFGGVSNFTCYWFEFPNTLPSMESPD